MPDQLIIKKPVVALRIRLIFAVFAVLYGSISLVNHYLFRTYALDLGLYTNALYDYAHFQWNDSSVFKTTAENLLADHFDWWLMLISPLSYIFKSYTLLIVQIGFILIGAKGIVRYFTFKSHPEKLVLAACMYFLTFFGIFSCLSFDYHSNVIAAMLTPWFLCFIQENKKGKALIIAFLILIAKENMSLWLTFICFGLLLEKGLDKKTKSFLAGLSIVCIAFFILVTGVIMPSLSSSGTYPHFHYSVLGSNSYEAILHLIQHPIESFQLLFINPTNNPYADFVKTELHIILFLLGLPILFFRPRFFLMLIPIYFQKLYHDSYQLWGIDGQYSIEFAPIMTIGVFTVIGEFKKEKAKNLVSVGMVFLSLIATVRVMDHTIMFTNKSRIRFYQLSHYTRNYNVQAVYEAFKQIPDHAIVSCQSPYLPHLALRDTIYMFPIIKDAQYILLNTLEDPYPLTADQLLHQTDSIRKSGNWDVLVDQEQLILLKKKPVIRIN